MGGGERGGMTRPKRMAGGTAPDGAGAKVTMWKMSDKAAWAVGPESKAQGQSQLQSSPG